MNFIDLQQKLSELNGCKITQTDIASALNVTRQNINKRLKNNSELSYDEMLKLENYFNIAINEKNQIKQTNNSTDILKLDYYPDFIVNSENLKNIFSECKNKINVQKNYIGAYSQYEKYIVINAKDESMYPCIHNMDLLIVKIMQEQEKIQDNKIYILLYDGQIFIRRLLKNILEIVVKSDNIEQGYRTQIIDNENLKKLKIIGQIVGIIRKID